MRHKDFFSTSLLLTALSVSSAACQRVAQSTPQTQSNAPAAPANPPSPPAVEIPAGTTVRVRLNQALDTARNRAGDSFEAVLDSPVTVDGTVVIPNGTLFHGHLTAAKARGRLRGRGLLAVRLDSFDLNGQTYPITTSSRSRATSSHNKRNLALIGGGAGFGALVGGLARGGSAALIGAGAGAAAGTGGALLTGKKQVYLPAETPITFQLQEPVRIQG